MYGAGRITRSRPRRGDVVKLFFATAAAVDNELAISPLNAAPAVGPFNPAPWRHQLRGAASDEWTVSVTRLDGPSAKIAMGLWIAPGVRDQRPGAPILTRAASLTEALREAERLICRLRGRPEANRPPDTVSDFPPGFPCCNLHLCGLA
jgi:hypothetical protein